MKVAIDISPLQNSHKFRGTGYYLKNLKTYLTRLLPDEDILFFSEKKTLPSDISVIHYPYFDPFFLTFPLRETGKTVVTVHDLTPLVFPKSFPVGVKGRIKWQIQKTFLKRTARIITDSEASKKDIIKFTGINADRIDVVYLAAGKQFQEIKDTRLLQQIKDKYSLPDTFILYVGDVTWNKNLPRLMKAIQSRKVPLVLVGKAVNQSEFDDTNPWNQDLSEVVNLATSDPLFIRLGFVPDEDLPYIYNLASVFAMPSLYEGFGLPLLEAMACGVAVVTSDRGSIPEVVGDAAEIVDPYDIASIAKGISHLLDDKKKRSSFSKKGLERASTFSWQKTAKETYTVYQKAYTMTD